VWIANGNKSSSNQLRLNYGEPTYLYINLACLSVCLYPINVKTAEPIGPKFFVGPHVTPGKVYECTKFKEFVLKSFLFL